MILILIDTVSHEEFEDGEGMKYSMKITRHKDPLPAEEQAKNLIDSIFNDDNEGADEVPPQLTEPEQYRKFGTETRHFKSLKIDVPKLEPAFRGLAVTGVIDNKANADGGRSGCKQLPYLS